MRWLRWAGLALGLTAAVAASGGVQRAWNWVQNQIDEDRVFPHAPVDRAAAPAKQARVQASAAMVGPQSVPPGDSQAHVAGVFGPAFEWPIIPIHMVLLPDGRVLSYGSKTDGQQGGMLNYSLWDPALGTNLEANMLLPNVTGTDLFCAGQALLPSGDVLMVGGDRKVANIRNYANNDVNIFYPSTNQLIKQGQSMAYQRWYATAVTTSTGEQVVMGGRMDKDYEGGATAPPSVATYASVPEAYSAASGWRILSTAGSDDAYGALKKEWWYPQAWSAPNGQVFILAHGGRMYNLDPTGSGTLTQLSKTAPMASENLPSVMYSPGKILSVRNNKKAVIVGIGQALPTVKATGSLSWHRLYGNATLLADGKVWANGGSSTGNDLVGAAYHSETWDPATGVWTTGATAAKARLYHSSSMLMPDATVLTGGGGAPGPLTNLNAEIYYPPYLYKTDGSGLPADRPAIATAPTALGWNQPFEVHMTTADPVSRVTLVRSGTVTHAFNSDQRFIELKAKQQGSKLKITSPSNRNNVPPGYYMLFAFDANGVPSIARTIRLTD